MARKQRPFTRKQRARIQKRKRVEAAAERREVRAEEKLYQRGLVVFKDIPAERTEDLADGRL